LIALLGGVGAAVCFGFSTLFSSRSSRMIGSASVVAWMMLIGLLAILPWLVAGGVPDGLNAVSGTWLVLSGLGNVVGLLIVYAALRIERVGVVAPITSTEGAVAALIAAAAGEAIGGGTALVLAVIAVGVILAGLVRDDAVVQPHGRRGVVLALLSACCFGIGIYATGRVGEDLPVVWAVLPARLTGVLLVAVPLLVTTRLRLTRQALPFVVASGLAEVVGWVSFALGARHGIAVTAVLSSQFAAVASIGAYAIYGERLGRVQLVGVALILAGVAGLSALRA
jgi:drug/metabolite transporter (DMT)-like permease